MKIKMNSEGTAKIKMIDYIKEAISCFSEDIKNGV